MYLFFVVCSRRTCTSMLQYLLAEESARTKYMLDADMGRTNGVRAWLNDWEKNSICELFFKLSLISRKIKTDLLPSRNGRIAVQNLCEVGITPQATQRPADKRRGK